MFSVKRPNLSTEVLERMRYIILDTLLYLFKPSIDCNEGTRLEGRILRSLTEGLGLTVCLSYRKMLPGRDHPKSYPVQMHIDSWEKYGLANKRDGRPSLEVLHLSEGYHDNIPLPGLSHVANRRIWWTLLEEFAGVYPLPTYLPSADWCTVQAVMATVTDPPEPPPSPPPDEEFKVMTSRTWLMDWRLMRLEMLQDGIIWGPSVLDTEGQRLLQIYEHMMLIPEFS